MSSSLRRHRPLPAMVAPAVAFVMTLALAACSPALDWRELRPEGSGAVLLMPCRPASHARQLPLAGAPVAWTLYACRADGVTWGFGFAELDDPARVGPALQALADAALANIGAASAERLVLRVDGATPNPAAARLAAEGRLSDGQPVQEQVAVFSKGTRVFQATAVGERLPADALQTFFDNLRTP